MTKNELKELDALFARLDRAVWHINAGDTTLESVVSEFGLIKTKCGYIHPRWGWSVEFDEGLGYNLYY